MGLNSNQEWILENLGEDILEYIQENNGNKFTKCPDCGGLMARVWYSRDHGGKVDVFKCQEEDCDEEMEVHPKSNSYPDTIRKQVALEEVDGGEAVQLSQRTTLSTREAELYIKKVREEKTLSQAAEEMGTKNEKNRWARVKEKIRKAKATAELNIS